MSLKITAYLSCGKHNPQMPYPKFDAYTASLTENVKEPGIYQYGASADIYACSARDFNRYRDTICLKVANVSHKLLIKAEPDRSTLNLPFIELLLNSDCQGSFDTATCQKLLADFEKHRLSLLKKCTDDFFTEFYMSLEKGFRIAAGSKGFIHFS